MNILTHKASRIALASAVVLASGLFTASASASAAMEDFESGLGTWTHIGDASTRIGGPASAGGSAYALLTSATLGADDYPAASAAFNFSGVAAATSAAMESALGTTAGALDPDLDNFVFATEGSVLQKSFSVSAGETLSFNWNFLSNESSVGALGDYAFVSLDGNIFRLADTSSNLTSSAVFASQTGYRAFSHTFSSAGTVTIGFGVVDVNDGAVSSALAIDNVQISAVPEPSAAALLSLGLVGLGFAQLRRGRAL